MGLGLGDTPRTAQTVYFSHSPTMALLTSSSNYQPEIWSLAVMHPL